MIGVKFMPVWFLWVKHFFLYRKEKYNIFISNNTIFLFWWLWNIFNYLDFLVLSYDIGPTTYSDIMSIEISIKILITCPNSPFFLIALSQSYWRTCITNHYKVRYKNQTKVHELSSCFVSLRLYRERI